MVFFKLGSGLLPVPLTLLVLQLPTENTKYLLRKKIFVTVIFKQQK